MPLVVLIGDSIRMGYQRFVRENLDGEAEVWAPAENGGTSSNVLAHIDEWVTERNPDIVHINCGLHDLKTEFDADQKNIPLDQYRENVEKIFSTILEMTSSKIIWATTTPVNEQWHHERKGFDRFETDVETYNRVAIRIAQNLGVQINDLYEVVMKAGRDRLLREDGVHFTEEGSALLGQAVAKSIRSCL